MPEAKKSDWRRRIFPVVLTAGAVLILIFVLLRIRQLGETERSDLRGYDYLATRRLVRLTAQGARLLEEKGGEAFDDFSADPDRWSVEGESYLYVYDREGVNLFHGGYPELRGQDLRDLTDLLGRNIHRLILDQLDNHSESNPHGWCHYLWAAPGSLQGTWKSSCHFPATLPDGRKVYIGSGLNTPLVEREFFRINVDQAAEFLAGEGTAALAGLKDPQGPFTIYDEAVFVLDREGRAIIDPSLDLKKPRDLFEYRDLSGRFPLRELAERVEKEKTGWVVTLSRERAGGHPVKKGIYGRNSELNSKPVIVGALCELPEPAWMR
ncbi:MAG: cache domain-containing protein [Candidatus Erginobacter occultus]|nr:cache domain-containing protein [Candidatus Erginobacter occultus]